ncbi:hypothetical protein DWX58_09755 [Pseudoflavonifractor sp. AF19-9AC]|uniref:S-layer homology domain-containing protein n=1 Tax=Pseudoflavonifractor sp. AF19-9AC TaxID=2292244 RepID=UPI000E46D96A|nr:S-layer homology domain-containing protein [Pseudoflavonifractor sp. AF19-9AC]RHR08100.1 hypothetical protein DWX58_09755 [Pseudoflavonifractor sp. AF19-9AC]
MRKRKLLSLVMAMAMVLSLLPMTVWAVSEYKFVNVNGTRLTDPGTTDQTIDVGSGTVSWDADQATMTLDNITATGSVEIKFDSPSASTAVKIVLKGSNTINSTSTGIYTNGNLTIQAEEGASLLIHADDTNWGNAVNGIWTEGDLTISGGSYEIDSTNAAIHSYGTATISDTVMELTCPESYFTVTGNEGTTIQRSWLYANGFGAPSTASWTDSVSIVNTQGTVIGNATLPASVTTVPEQVALTIPTGSSLTIPTGQTLSLSAGSSLTVEGEVIHNNALQTEAQIGQTQYATLAEAISQASDNAVIDLLRDVTLSNTLSISKPVTIDGHNQYAIKESDSSSRSSHLIDVSADNVVLQNVKIEAYRAAEASSNSNHAVNVSGDNVIIKNVTISGSTGHGLQFYKAKNCQIENVTSKDNLKTGLTVNASSVTATGTLTFEDNGWESLPNSLNVGFGENIEDATAASSFDFSDATLNGVSVVYTGAEDFTNADTRPITIIPNSDYVLSTKDGAVLCLPVDTTPAVAQIGNVKYASLADAIEQAAPGATVTLLKNITLTDTVTIAKNIVLDLNETTLTGSNSKTAVAFTSAATVKNGTITSSVLPVLINGTSAVVTIDGVTLDGNGNYGLQIGTMADGNQGGAIIKGNSNISGEQFAGVVIWGSKNVSAPTTLVMESGTISGKYYGISGNGSYDGTSITLNSGSVQAIDSTDSTGIYHPQQGTLTVNAGVSVSGLVGIQAAGGTVIINGGTVTSTDETVRNAPYKNPNESDGNVLDGSALSLVSRTAYGDINVTINGGTFTAHDGNDSIKLYGYQKTSEGYQVIDPPTNASLTITGGTFSSDPSAYTSTGSIVKRDGTSTYTYTVLPKSGLTSGIYLSDPTGFTASNYYVTNNNDGTWTVYYSAPSGGGSSSSGDKTETVTNPDGSTTTTVTKPDGTVTETTKNPDGSKEVVETKKDGTVTTTTTDKAGNKTETVEKTDGSTETAITNKDGSSSTTTVSKDGQVEAEVKLPTTVVDNAQEEGEPVALPMPEVPVTTDEDDAPTVTVDLPAGRSARVLIPVDDVTPGTVAILVHENGTKEIAKTSITTEEGVVVTLSDGDTVKVMDNAKDFADVPDAYWGSAFVDFATSRGLFSGTSATTFSPDLPMTRAMIVTVLAAYDGADTTAAAGDHWYSAGQQWAMENGVSDGTNMEGVLTREQLAVMLWSYAGRPETSISLSRYSDAGSVSAWAADAMTWAVENGLISGSDKGELLPQGQATRVQVATILMRFVETTNG